MMTSTGLSKCSPLTFRFTFENELKGALKSTFKFDADEALKKGPRLGSLIFE